jgi:microcystin-dependent protein
MAGNVNVSGIVSGASGGTITGEVKMWATGTAPTGYLMCDGSVISRTTYANLFAVIGTTFGSGDGSTTFKLPSFQNRMPIGAGSTYSANTTGGSADAIVPSHSHTFSGDALPAHNHTIPYGTGFFGGGGSNGIEAGSSRPSYPLGNSSVSGGTPSGTISTAGVSATNANLPPYIGIHFIIRT